MFNGKLEKVLSSHTNCTLLESLTHNPNIIQTLDAGLYKSVVVPLEVCVRFLSMPRVSLGFA